jgi:hypothetical protein
MKKDAKDTSNCVLPSCAQDGTKFPGQDVAPTDKRRRLCTARGADESWAVPVCMSANPHQAHLPGLSSTCAILWQRWLSLGPAAKFGFSSGSGIG